MLLRLTSRTLVVSQGLFGARLLHKGHGKWSKTAETLLTDDAKCRVGTILRKKDLDRREAAKTLQVTTPCFVLSTDCFYCFLQNAHGIPFPDPMLKMQFG